MNRRALTSLMVAFGVCVAANQADAHIQLTCPPARYAYSAQGIKTAPCGALTGTKSMKVTHLVAGQQLLVTFTETVFHPGFFRISLDTTGGEGFPPISPTPESPIMLPVIADNILPHTSGTSGAKRMYVVTVPNTPCAKCTLQLTQFMMDNPTSGYYECADVVVDAAGTPFSCGPTGVGGAGGPGGADGGGGKPGSGGGGGAGGTAASGGTTGSAGAPGSGGASASGTGGTDATGSGGADSSASGGSSSGGSTSTGGVSSGGATSSGGAISSGGTNGSGGASSGGASSGGTNGGTSNGSGGSGSGGKGSGETNNSASGGCAYVGGGISLASTLGAFAAVAFALARRRRSPR
jgi:hypothetical protein